MVSAFLFLLLAPFAHSGPIPEQQLDELEKTFTEVGLHRLDTTFIYTKSKINTNDIACEMAENKTAWYCKTKEPIDNFFCQVASDFQQGELKNSTISDQGHLIQCEARMWFCEKKLSAKRKCWSRWDYEQNRLKEVPVTGKSDGPEIANCAKNSDDFRSLIEKNIPNRNLIEQVAYINKFKDRSAAAAYIIDRCDNLVIPANKK